jgi:hypothetical protein
MIRELSAPPRAEPPFLVLSAAALTPRRGVAWRLLRAGITLTAGGLALFALRRA